MLTDLEFTYTNTSSLSKIPKNLKPLINEVTAVYKEVYGDQLKAVYATGSFVRGVMVRGSDADFYVIINGKNSHRQVALRKRRWEELGKKHRPFGLAYVDGIAIPESQFGAAERRAQLVKIQVDGVHLFGSDYNFTHYLPSTRREFVELLESHFKKAVINTSRLWEGGNKQKVRRGYAKSIIRAIYDCLAYAQGSNYTRSIIEMLPYISRYANQYAETAQWLYKLYISSIISDDETLKLERAGRETLVVCQQAGFRLDGTMAG